MTLKSRLAKLEGDPKDGLEQFGNDLAILLGEVDGLFWPERERGAVHLVGIDEKRTEYHESGLPWRGQDSTPRAWKRSQRKREAMAAAGLINIKKGAGSLPLVKIKEMEKARKLIGLATIDTFRVRLISALLVNDGKDPERSYGPNGWVSETGLFRTSYADKPKSSDWDWETSTLLPMLVGGFVRSKPTTLGHIFYQATEKELPEVDEKEVDQVEADASLVDVYLDSFFDCLNRRKSYRSSSGGIFIPLPATQ